MPQSIILLPAIAIAGIIIGLLSEVLHGYLDERKER